MKMATQSPRVFGWFVDILEPNIAKKAIQELLDRSAAFRFEPFPDDSYRIYFDAEHKDAMQVFEDAHLTGEGDG